MAPHRLDPRCDLRSAGPGRALLALALFAAVSIAPSACSKSSEQAPPADDSAKATDPAEKPPVAKAAPGQWYRAVFSPEDTPEIPIYLQLPAPGTTGTGKVVNGGHEAEFDASWSGKDLKIAFPLFHALINATADAKGELSGTWQVESRTWGSGLLPFRASPVDSPAPEKRFDSESLPGEPIDLGQATTYWRAEFPESGTVKFVIHQVAPGVFNATVQFPTGNLVYLAGNGRGSELRMSALIGLSIYILSAKVEKDMKSMTGKWISGPHLAWREAMKAKRGQDFELPISVKTKREGQLFSMPQLARYDGKPLIVELGGSWCDACKHAASALKPIYERLHPRGLEVVSLTYEFTDDSAYNKRQAEDFKKTYGLPWEVIPVDGSVEQAWEIIPEGIEGVDASGFPITLFVNRDGSIRGVHASFAGPEHPKEHARWVKEYEELAAAIVGNESASASGKSEAIQ